MREIVIDSGAPPELIRAVVVGAFKSGKTFFASTFPAPLFIADASEGGYKTLYEMDPALWWDPSVKPEVWAIESYRDIGQVALPRLETMAQQNALRFRTIVFDPVSIYSDRVLAEMQAQDPGRDNRQNYGDLAVHLRSLLLRFHALPAHVIWLSHTKEGDSGPTLAIQGQMAEKFGAWMDFIWYTNVTTIPNRPPAYELRTAPFRNVKFLGSRWKLPDPMIPSFKSVAAALRMPIVPVSPTLPGAPAPASAAASANGQGASIATVAVSPPRPGGFRRPAPRRT